MNSFGLVLVAVMLGLAPAAGAQSMPVATPETVGMSSQRLARIATALEADIAGGRLPGAVVAIARQGKLVYLESFGFLDKAGGKTMPKDAIFSIASMTKPVVTVGALMLYEEGKISLNEPISVYLPEFKNLRVAIGGDPAHTEAARRQPTVQDLMRHTSGFTTGDQGTTALHRQYPLSGPPAAEAFTGPEFLARLGSLPLHHQPGTTWDYSFGLDILGLLIERVSGQSLGNYLQTRLFAPLGMVDTSFVIPQAKAPRQAQVLPNDPVTGATQTTRNQTRSRKFECGGGCLASTVTDYMQFAHMLLRKGVSGTTRILGRKTVEYMTADHLTPDMDLTRLDSFQSDHTRGFGFGLAVAVRRGAGLGGTMGSPEAFHWPGSQGTAFWVDPKEDLVIVYMAQTPGDTRRYYRQLIPALVLQAIVD